MTNLTQFGVTNWPVHKTQWKIMTLLQREKGQTNATNAIMHALIQVHWGHIWKHTAEKSQTNATNVIMHLLAEFSGKQFEAT